ncbi:[acyl-carrier-protein] S-malonyltransferase [Desulfonauticus submarinus]|uniref:Malonyl CoA-acyl carrier protein transacylase n=1 Tax=Desulfonauticus submarinus TaxID=206665 RepID=A0A1H0A154_9BACT|nr:ACP S-malonyltransferase [Desulfonauticus submarinus]SDN26891.1 [acyl-carrier-protein] S-malonyltransferase [Desulfonauticus submarinus]
MTLFEGALLFPGQGSQEKGMGRDLAEFWPEAMDLWKIGEKISGFPLREIYWDGEAKDQAKTIYLQPAMTVVNLSLWFYLKSHLKPLSLAGHSLGEYSALVAAKVIEVQDALKLVSIRGKLMQEAGTFSPGAMVAVLKMPLSQLENLVSKLAEKGTILIANYNTYTQYVVSGEINLIDELVNNLKSYKGVRAIKLPVNGAFHSPLMREASLELAKEIEKVHFSSPDFPVYLNSTGEKELNPDRIKTVLKEQMISSVFWIQSIENMYKQGIYSYLEIGPKNVLSKMTAQILADKTDVKVYKCSNLKESKSFAEVK